MSEFSADHMRIFREALAAQDALKPAAVPLHKHGAFDELTTHLSFIQLASAALCGIGAMIQPSGHEQSISANQSDAAAVFSFFGEALKGPANEAYNASERLQRAAVSDARIS